MYERFTDRARKVMYLANQEAQRWNHEYIGAEHLLLGLLGEASGVASNVLRNLDLDLSEIRQLVENHMTASPDMVTMGKLPQTPRAKKAIEQAIEFAREMGHNYVGTEHILIGLLRVSESEKDCIVSKVCAELNINTQQVVEETGHLLGDGISKKANPEQQRQEFYRKLMDEIGGIRNDCYSQNISCEEAVRRIRQVIRNSYSPGGEWNI